MSEQKNINITLKVWRQEGPKEQGPVRNHSFRRRGSQHVVSGNVRCSK